MKIFGYKPKAILRLIYKIFTKNKDFISSDWPDSSRKYRCITRFTGNGGRYYSHIVMKDTYERLCCSISEW